MSEIVAVTCSSCGGAIALEAGKRVPRCVYCGSQALEVGALDERVEQPDRYIPFALSPEQADGIFRKFTRSSFWHPNAIRNATLELDRVLLAAWAWSGTVETHFAGLVPAASSSGKRPVTGSDIAQLEGVVVPSSTALNRAELAAIAPFQHTEEQPYDPHTAEDPFEPGRLSRSAARDQATAAMEQAHATRIRQRTGAKKLNVASVLTDVAGRPVLLPVYVGAWRYKDRVFRVVINGQTGRLSGKAPFSWLKLALVVGGVLGVCFLVMLCVGVLGALAQ